MQNRKNITIKSRICTISCSGNDLRPAITNSSDHECGMTTLLLQAIGWPTFGALNGHCRLQSHRVSFISHISGAKVGHSSQGNRASVEIQTISMNISHRKIDRVGPLGCGGVMSIYTGRPRTFQQIILLPRHVVYDIKYLPMSWCLYPVIASVHSVYL